MWLGQQIYILVLCSSTALDLFARNVRWSKRSRETRTPAIPGCRLPHNKLWTRQTNGCGCDFLTHRWTVLPAYRVTY